jgi:cell division transport system permease protein
MTRARQEDVHATGFLRYCLEEAAVSLRRRWRVAVLSTLLLAAAVFVLASYLLVSQRLGHLTASMTDAAELSVYLDRAAPPGSREAIEATLGDMAAVRVVDPIPAAQARARFLQDFPELADVLGSLPEDAFGDVVDVRLAAEATAADIDVLVAHLRQMPGVEDVILDRDVLARVLVTVQLVRRAGAMLAVLIILAAAGSVTAVLRLAYYARRDEIEVLALLGAPPRAITGPFVAEGMLQAATGALGALLTARLLLEFGGSLAGGWLWPMDGEGITFLTVGVQCLVAGGATAAGGLAGWLAARAPRERPLRTPDGARN